MILLGLSTIARGVPSTAPSTTRSNQVPESREELHVDFAVSQQLAVEFFALLPTVVTEQQPKNAEGLQMDVTELAAQIRAQCPGFTIVSRADAVRLQQERYDDAANRAKYEKLIGVCRDFALRLTPIETHLLRTGRSRPLRGIKLELLVRLLESHLKEISEDASLREASKGGQTRGK